ncbi:MAG: hypothetical protein WAM08_09420 [Candidatus Acidiferrales bacterium]
MAIRNSQGGLKLIAKAGYCRKITCDGPENNKIPVARLSRHARAETNPADSAIRS